MIFYNGGCSGITSHERDHLFWLIAICDSGYGVETMAQASRTFRIFVSSTFSDLKAERNALQQEVFPKLRELCQQHGCRFQAIDLRWGVSEEDALDQQMMKISLDEIVRCQRVTSRPNFIVLLGDRYGWRPLPAEIPATEYEQLQQRVVNAADQALLKAWYRRDDNAVPVVYCLQPRTGDFREHARWQEVESRLHSILLQTTQEMTSDERSKYTASATEQEIVSGALRVADAPEHVFGFFRKILTKNNLPLVEDLPPGESVMDFVDLVKVGEGYQLDAEAHRLLEELREGMKLDSTGLEDWNLIKPLHETWSEHDEFIELPDAVMPTLYRKLSTQDCSERRRIYDRNQHRFIILGGPLWTWCERERQKYEKPELPWKTYMSSERLTVFISAKSADYKFAEQIYQFLRLQGISTFLSQESLPELANSDYRKEIDRALDGANHMIVVTSSVSNVNSSWLRQSGAFL